MKKRTRGPVLWAAVILALLVGAYVIVARSGPVPEERSAAGYVH